jgi:hypothetical protein
MKHPFLIATALLALTGVAAAADAKERLYRYYLDGHLVKAWTRYCYGLDGHLVKHGYSDGSSRRKKEDYRSVEIRLVPGWQLDPTCPPSKWGKDCAGGQGYLLFEGQWKDGVLSGSARLDRDGCDEYYEASGGRTKDGGLVLYPVNGAAECKAIFKPVLGRRGACGVPW